MESVELRHSVFKIGCTGTCGAQPTVVGRLCCCLCLSVLHFISLLLPHNRMFGWRCAPRTSCCRGRWWYRPTASTTLWRTVGSKEWQLRLCLFKGACFYFYFDIISFTSPLSSVEFLLSSSFFFLWFGLSLTFNENQQERYTYPASRPRTSSGERCKFAFKLLPPEPHDGNKGILFILHAALCWCREQWPAFGRWKWEIFP